MDTVPRKQLRMHSTSGNCQKTDRSARFCQRESLVRITLSVKAGMVQVFMIEITKSVWVVKVVVTARASMQIYHFFCFV